MRSAWRDVAETLSMHLDTLDAARLESSAGGKFPIEDGETVLGALSFLVQHDTYHLGQIALLRRYLGLAPISYR